MLATRSSVLRARLALAASALALAAVPATASAQVTPVTAGMEGNTLSEFTQAYGTNATIGVAIDRAYEGTHSAVASYAGGTANAFARGVQYVGWQSGDNVWYGAAYYLPTGFKAAMHGEVALMRWDNWPTYGTTGADVGGLVIWGSDHKARVKVGGYNRESTLIGPFDFPEGRWVWAEIHQRFSSVNGQALTEMYLDGQKIGSSTAANMSGRTIERIRYGLVAMEGGAQTNPLKLWFDRASIASSELGPLGGSTPAPAPAPSPAPAPTTSPTTSPTAAPSTSTSSGDRTAPTATITSPYENQPFGNGLGIHVTATDDVAVTKVEFLLDGRLVGTRTGTPWVISLDTTNLPLGTHKITVKAYDKAGNVGVASRTVQRVKSTVSAVAASASASHRPARAARRTCRRFRFTFRARRHGHLVPVHRVARGCGTTTVSRRAAARRHALRTVRHRVR